MKPIVEIAAKLGLDPGNLVQFGTYKAKVDPAAGPPGRPAGKLILVTAMTPTPAGEGKTTTAIGLVDALTRAGKKALAALREPSLGPVFGMKGGATGGGKARVVSGEDINLHFTGDLHAVSSAHNLLAALVENRLHFDGPAGLLDGRNVYWKRVVDMNDRALRQIIIGLEDTYGGMARESGFDITAASEVMAVFCLSRDLADLKARLGRIVVGCGLDLKPVTAAALKAPGAMAALLRDALRPNLVQTLEETPVFVHGGPFANIAHGANSVIATGLALRLADYVVTECGFGSDLGAEKFFDIVVRSGAVPPPSAVVIVATLRSLKYHGGVKLDALLQENIAAMDNGYANLQAHVDIVRQYGLPVVVALNRFPADSPAEIAAFTARAAADRLPYALSDVFGAGGPGGLDLAAKVVEAASSDAGEFRFLYPLEALIPEKLEAIARRIYGADRVVLESPARKKLKRFEDNGFSGLPVCVAKTQYSLSDNPKLLGRPNGFPLTVTDLSISAGAGFVVALCGDIMTMPGMPKSPAAERIDVSDDGVVSGILG